MDVYADFLDNEDINWVGVVNLADCIPFPFKKSF